MKEVEYPSRFGVAELNPNRTIKDIEEKPKIPKTSFAVTRLYIYYTYENLKFGKEINLKTVDDLLKKIIISKDEFEKN